MTPNRLPLHTTRAQQFGPEYEQLLLTVWKQTPFRFPLASPKETRSMRTKMYAYFRHLRAENLRLDLIEIADALTLQVENETTLVFLRNEETWDHDRIRAILGLHKDKFGLVPEEAGTELRSPELLGARLGRKLEQLRERQSGGQRIVSPMRTATKTD